MSWSGILILPAWEYTNKAKLEEERNKTEFIKEIRDSVIKLKNLKIVKDDYNKFDAEKEPRGITHNPAKEYHWFVKNV